MLYRSGINNVFAQVAEMSVQYRIVLLSERKKKNRGNIALQMVMRDSVDLVYIKGTALWCF